MSSRVSVVELVNHTRHEIVVSVMSGEVLDGIATLRASPAEPASRWSSADLVDHLTVEEGLPYRDAERLVENYVGALERPGWTVLRQASL